MRPIYVEMGIIRSTMEPAMKIRWDADSKCRARITFDASIGRQLELTNYLYPPYRSRGAIWEAFFVCQDNRRFQIFVNPRAGSFSLRFYQLSLLGAQSAPGAAWCFSGSCYIGTILHSGSAEYDAAQHAYTLTGSGENMWFSSAFSVLPGSSFPAISH